MSKYKAAVKDKWSDSRGKLSDTKGKVTGYIPGRKKSPEQSTHAAAPLSSLRDPSSFAPPPRRTGSGLAPPPPPTPLGQRKVITAPSKYQDPVTGWVDPQAKPSGERQLLLEGPGEEDDIPRPPQPYRVNTTGLSTDHLPRPPARRDGSDGWSPPSYDDAVSVKKSPAPTPGGAPSLPPRLPPRSGSGSPDRTNPISVLGGGPLNQGAVSRLGAAGISVPAFGIGPRSPAGDDDDDDSPPPPPPPRPRSGSKLNGLQNRFSKLGTSTSSTGTTPPPSEGTTWAQKQAALKTASSFQKDPSSVSFADVKTAASTANNFRQRHGDQISAGVKSANNLNQKYGVADKVGGFAGATGQGAAGLGLAGKKKPPPPPPKKKQGLVGDAPPPLPPHPAADEDTPPPVPLSTRPTF